MSESVAVCKLKDRVAPRYDRCPEIVLATINDAGVLEEKKVLAIDTLKPHEVASLLKRNHVTTLICGGVKEQGQKDLRRYNIRLVDNVIGNVEEVLALYVDGKLRSGDTGG